MRINKIGTNKIILILILVAFVVLNPSKDKHQEKWVDFVSAELEETTESTEDEGEIAVKENVFDSNVNYINLLILSFTLDNNIEKGLYLKTFGLLGQV